MSQAIAPELHQLPPLANLIVDRAIDNTQRKLIAGFRNKDNSRPNAKTTDVGSSLEDTAKATSASSVMAVANRGIAWREMIQKSLSHGISSLSTAQFDGEFKIKNGKAEGLDNLPEQPGVYVVYDASGKVAYVGDSGNLKQRWRDGHMDSHRLGEKNGKPYKLADQFEEGCTVRFIKMDSVETAAAVEAHWIKDEADRPSVNKRAELKEEQGKRSNIEAKKMKDASGSTSSLLKGAGVELAKNMGWQNLEQLTSVMLKALKGELVDILAGGKSRISQRVERFFHQIWAAIRAIFDAPLKLLAGIVEFIVNAFSKAISQIYGLARNLFDLANGAWNLFRGAKTMSTEELVQKVSETIIVSGCLVIWDALDPIIEAQLLPMLGPAAPYVSCAITAMGFGLSSFYLQKIVPAIVDFLVAFKQGWTAALDAKRDACLQLIVLEENEWKLVSELEGHARSTGALINDMQQHVQTLSAHRPVQRIDMRALRASRRNLS
ncbi:GIY-YIG nuclease family protein [Cupriavidus oxalaticus]|uniref:GIY-YIG nuclease family protein n=1 Tax=Cupriavidus oxalaticus TaxID=96344 RepID=UPI00317BB66A